MPQEVKFPSIGYVIGKFPVPSETFVYREVIALKKMGHEISVASFRRPSDVEVSKLPPEAVNLMEHVDYLCEGPWKLASSIRISEAIRLFAIASNCRQIFSGGKIGRAEVVQALRACALGQWAKQNDVDQFHAHWPYATRVVLLASQRYGIPFSLSVHAHEVAHENEHLEAALQHAKFASFCNKAALEFLKNELDRSLYSKMKLNYHGVDTEKFSFAPMPTVGSETTIVTVGRLTKTKGIDRLLNAVAACLKQRQKVRLRIIGDGKERLLLEQQCEKLNLHNHVDFVGWIEPSEVVGELKRSSGFALLADTAYHDGLPNVVLEAMSVGRPVIVSPLPAANEVIVDGESGFILNSADDINGFAALMRVLSEDPSFAAKIGSQAAAEVRRCHSAEVHIKGLAENLFAR